VILVNDIPLSINEYRCIISSPLLILPRESHNHRTTELLRNVLGPIPRGRNLICLYKRRDSLGGLKIVSGEGEFRKDDEVELCVLETRE